MLGLMMNMLQKITIEYDESEDRMRLAGEGGDRSCVVLWLSQRLLRRLIPVLIEMIGTKSGDSEVAETILGFEQEAAWAALEPQHPVQVSVGDTSWLVHAIDLKLMPEMTSLEFRGARPGDLASLAVDAKAMRQWLSILRGQFARAEWPLDIWPRWMDGNELARTSTKAQFH